MSLQIIQTFTVYLGIDERLYFNYGGKDEAMSLQSFYEFMRDCERSGYLLLWEGESTHYKIHLMKEEV